jgi:NAD(P)-dependent dehydrogenase (short-subunit alcohol dehydrogenase family)
MDLGLAGKRAIVTGGSRGIGKAIARQLAMRESMSASPLATSSASTMGYLRCAREVAPLMVAQGWGRIINVSGLAARQSGSILGSIRNVSVAR